MASGNFYTHDWHKSRQLSKAASATFPLCKKIKKCKLGIYHQRCQPKGTLFSGVVKTLNGYSKRFPLFPKPSAFRSRTGSKTVIRTKSTVCSQ